MAGQGTTQPKGKIGRRLFHVGAGCIPPVLGLILSRQTLLLVLGIMATLIIVAEALRLIVPGINQRLTALVAPASSAFKPRESARPTGTTFFLVGAFLSFLFFAQPATVAALFFAAIGDALAATVGERYGRTKVGRRSLEGSAAFLASAAFTGAILMAFGLPIRWPALALGAFVAALVELLPLPIDDNLTIPIVSAAVMSSLH